MHASTDCTKSLSYDNMEVPWTSDASRITNSFLSGLGLTQGEGRWMNETIKALYEPFTTSLIALSFPPQGYCMRRSMLAESCTNGFRAREAMEEGREHGERLEEGSMERVSVGSHVWVQIDGEWLAAQVESASSQAQVQVHVPEAPDRSPLFVHANDAKLREPASNAHVSVRPVVSSPCNSVALWACIIGLWFYPSVFAYNTADC